MLFEHHGGWTLPTSPLMRAAAGFETMLPPKMHHRGVHSRLQPENECNLEGTARHVNQAQARPTPSTHLRTHYIRNSAKLLRPWQSSAMAESSTAGLATKFDSDDPCDVFLLLLAGQHSLAMA